MKCRVPSVFRPPRNLTSGIQIKRLERDVGVLGRASIQIQDLLAGLVGRNPEIGIGIIAAFIPGSWDAGRAVEAITQVSELYVGDVLGDTEQVRAGWHVRPTDVVLADPIELSQERITLKPQISQQSLLLTHESHSGRPDRTDPPSFAVSLSHLAPVAQGIERRFPKPLGTSAVP